MIHMDIPRFIKDTIESSRLRFGIPGAGIAYVQNGKVSWAEGFGVKNTNTDMQVSGHTVFCAASVSKVITAFLALQIWSQKGLKLDEGIGQHINLPDEDMSSITPRQILSHTSGLPNWFPHLVERLKGERALLPENCNLLSHPGERFIYSGEGYYWLQKVIENITDRSFELFAAQEVFSPLRMKHTSFVWKSAYRQTAAHAHDDANEPVDRSRAVELHAIPNASASLYTTPYDLGLFLSHLMLPDIRKIVDKMLSVQIDLSDRISWSLGWGVERPWKTQHPWYWHHGRGGFTNLVLWSAFHQKGLVVLTNTQRNVDAEHFTHELTDAILGDEHAAFAFLPVSTMKRLGFLV